MIYTPLHTLTDEELLLHAASTKSATDLEIELALRLELVLDQLSDMSEPLAPQGRVFVLEEFDGANP